MGCQSFKSREEFYPSKSARWGINARCKKCDIAAVNRKHTNNLPRALRNLWIRHKSNGIHGSKRRCEFTQEGCVTPDLLMEMWKTQDGKCAVTGVQLTHVQGQGFRIWTNVTLDRINPDLGYTKDNIRLVCRAVNYMKAAMTDQDMVKWAKAILNGPVAQGLGGVEGTAGQT